jgi:DNA-directed RNA polymerase subunit F
MIDAKIKNIMLRLMEGKKINSISDLFNLIRHLMEYVEKFKSLNGKEKNDLIYDNLIVLLNKHYEIEEASIYIVMINPYIENLILLSKSKILLNVKRKCLKQCI